MCGIVGYAGNIETACGKPLEVCLQGLERLEYRGYDSAGVALTAPGMDKVVVRKKAGRLKNLVEDIERKPMPLATVGIGHTRWATNGEPSDVNAHPHTSMDGKVAIIHNGIIENHEPLREELKARGYTFVSETDTEVIAHLVNWELKQGGTLREAVLRAIPQLRGAYGTVIMDSRHPDTLLAARSGSPLVIGLGMGENFIASDQLALLPVTRRFIFLEEGDIAEITRRSVNIFDKTGAEVKRQDIESNLQYDAGDKGIYRHYMQKEIYEQPNAIKNTLTGRISHGQVDLSELGPNYVVITGAPMASGSIANIGYDRQNNSFWYIDCDYVPVSYPGTGDLFASVLTGGFLTGDSLPMAMGRAAYFVERCIKTTFSYSSDTRYGVMLEKELGVLIDRQNIKDFSLL